jgi:hypothetical protein
VALALGAIDVFLFLWTPGEGSYKSPLAVPVVTFFLLVCLYALFTEVMRRKLVVEMRGTDVVPPASDAPEHTGDSPPLPLRIEVSTTEDLLAASPREQTMLTRATGIFDHSIGLHRSQVYLLGVANALIAFLAVSLQQPFPISATPGMILFCAPSCDPAP